MATPRPDLVLAVRLDGAGHHPAAWREPEVDPAALTTPAWWTALAATAERGDLDLLLIDDAIGAPGPAGATDVVRARLDAVQLAARLALVTSSIGLVPTVTTTHTEPFHLGKNLGTLDWVSKGRAAWSVAVSTTDAEARLFGRKGVQDGDDLVAEADEAIEVVARLSDSWEDDAIIRDRPTGRFIDRDKVHHIDFRGEHFSVRGPSITPRSPQAQPLVVVPVGTGTHDPLVALAGRRADVVVLTGREADDLARLRRRVLDGATAAGRDPETLTVLVEAFVTVAADDETAQRRRSRLDERARFDAGDALDLVGGSGSVAGGLRELAAATGADGFVLAPLVLPTDLDALVDAIVPQLDRRPRPGPTLRDRLGLDRPANRYAATSGASA